MSDDEQFIIELNHENINIIEDIIFHLSLYNKLGNDKDFCQKKISEIISKKESSEKDKNKKFKFFLGEITNQFIAILSFLYLDFDLKLKKFERQNISIQIKENQIFLLLKSIEVNIKINGKKYLLSMKQIKIILTFTEDGKLIVKDFIISNFYINYFWIKLLMKSFIFFKKNYIIEMVQQHYFEVIDKFNELLIEFNINKLKIENNTLKIECIKI